MKFDELFPNVEVGKTPADYMKREVYDTTKDKTLKFRIAHYLKLEEEGPCFICGAPTKWAEINFEGHVCSEECDDKAWSDYSEACRQSDLRNKGAL